MKKAKIIRCGWLMFLSMSLILVAWALAGFNRGRPAGRFNGGLLLRRSHAPKPEKPTMPYVTMLYTCEARSQHVQMALIPEDSAGTATAHQRPPQESTASS